MKKKEKLRSSADVPVFNGDNTLMFELPELERWFKTVVGIRPFSRMQLWRMEQDGLFPSRVRLGISHNGRIAWPRAECQRWLEKKLAERPGNRFKVEVEREAAQR